MRIREQEEFIENMIIIENRKENIVRDLTKQLEKNTNNISNIQDALSRLENTLSNLLSKISFQESSVADLTFEVIEKEKVIHYAHSQIDLLNNRASELEIALEGSKHHFENLEAKAKMMKDDLTIIRGIGPRIVNILRSANIDSFKSLASIDILRIQKVLESINPNLLHIIEYTSWPEQARLASIGDWEALSSLQDSLSISRNSVEFSHID
jgi:predicted flap endonuclease-1-like 5' DNA nuclease